MIRRRMTVLLMLAFLAPALPAGSRGGLSGSCSRAGYSRGSGHSHSGDSRSFGGKKSHTPVPVTVITGGDWFVSQEQALQEPVCRGSLPGSIGRNTRVVAQQADHSLNSGYSLYKASRGMIYAR